MGRPRQFDESALFDVAEELFWTSGYDRTSIEEIGATAGLGNGSIYAGYGSKLGLFLKVFTRYCELKASFVERTFLDGPGPERSAVSAYFDAIIADCASQPGRRGCLMLNSIAELGSRFEAVREIGARSIRRMELSAARRFRVRSDGDFSHLDVHEIEALGAQVILVSQGLIQLSRLGVPVTRLGEIADAFCAALPASPRAR